MPRPKSLTAGEIAAAALAVIDRNALDALTIRAVAEELGMSTMSIYRYVKGREELERYIVDLVIASIDVSLEEHLSWRERIRILLQRFRDSVARHPQVAPLLLNYCFDSESALPWMEGLLETLAEAGFAGERRYIALRLMARFVSNSVQGQYMRGSIEQSNPPANRAGRSFPLAAEIPIHARNVTADREFSDQLAIILDGLAVTIEN
ncbi:TetR/AcrR family transcriptional regulator [Nocardia aobensis]|uniref:TetR/AcrR family transcriptional regulator n=1 Tax=Nocardia aobensis TaxID=257277 RepID=UPI000565E378|nr:TetR/AcrR family transcriptional regulator C-terminal domain-containing protein [Nocardia aobensis]